MRLGLPITLTIVLSVSLSVPAAAAGGQSPSNEDCLVCHSDASAARANGTSVAVDPRKLAASIHQPVNCVDCHADLAGAKEFPHAERLARARCDSCHDTVQQQYHDSIHSRAREKAGLVVAPACADCHGSHDVRPRTDAAARVFRTNIAATCGTCHAGIEKRYDTGIHAAAVKGGNTSAPTCANCHTAHTIQRVDTDAWRLSASAECGSCHDNVVASYRRTFHGKVNEMGFARIAACSDCHGAHDSLPASNPASMVSKARVVATCQTCHPRANESFAQFDPHPDPNNHGRSPLLWWVNRFYIVLIAGCFSLFGLHSALWYRRERQELREAAAHTRAPGKD